MTLVSFIKQNLINNDDSSHSHPLHTHQKKEIVKNKPERKTIYEYPKTVIKTTLFKT